MTDPRRAAVVLALALLVLLPTLVHAPMRRQQELRVAICGRNMARSGDWLVPVFQDQVRLRKPPLLYWLTGASMKIFGRENVEWIARLPGAALSLGLVAFTFVAARRLLGGRAAFAAGLATVATPVFAQYGALAETDGAQALFTAATVVFGWRAMGGAGRPGTARDWLAAGLCAGLGVLAKSPASLVIPSLTLAVYALSFRHRLRAQAWGGLAAGLVLAAAVGGSWYLAVWKAGPAGDAVAAEARALTLETEHPGPPWYYLYTGPARLLPGSLLLPWALAAAWRRRARPAARLLLCWLASALAVLSLLPSKQGHYVWLLLTPAALLTGAWAARFRPHWPGWFPPRVRRGALLLTVPALAGMGLILASGTQHAPSAEQRLARLAGRVADAPLVHVHGANSAIFDFYLGRHVHNADSPAAAWKRARPGEAVVLIGRPGFTPPNGDPYSGPVWHGIKPAGRSP